jgi:hypothetical protein
MFHTKANNQSVLIGMNQEDADCTSNFIEAAVLTLDFNLQISFFSLVFKIPLESSRISRNASVITKVFYPFVSILPSAIPYFDHHVNSSLYLDTSYKKPCVIKLRINCERFPQTATASHELAYEVTCRKSHCTSLRQEWKLTRRVIRFCLSTVMKTPWYCTIKPAANADVTQPM